MNTVLKTFTLIILLGPLIICGRGGHHARGHHSGGRSHHGEHHTGNHSHRHHESHDHHNGHQWRRGWNNGWGWGYPAWAWGATAAIIAGSFLFGGYTYNQWAQMAAEDQEKRVYFETVVAPAYNQYQNNPDSVPVRNSATTSMGS